MRLDEDARVLLVGVAELFARGYRFLHTRTQGRSRGDAHAAGADAAEIGQAVGGGGRLEAVGGLRDHKRERVLADAARSAEQDGVRQTAGGEALAQEAYRLVVAKEAAERHVLRVGHFVACVR